MCRGLFVTVIAFCATTVGQAAAQDLSDGAAPQELDVVTADWNGDGKQDYAVLMDSTDEPGMATC